MEHGRGQPTCEDQFQRSFHLPPIITKSKYPSLILLRHRSIVKTPGELFQDRYGFRGGYVLGNPCPVVPLVSSLVRSGHRHVRKPLFWSSEPSKVQMKMRVTAKAGRYPAPKSVRIE